MAFAYTRNTQNAAGGKLQVTGTYTSSSSGTGGDIVTGLKLVETMVLQPKGASDSATAPVVNETLPLRSTNGAVTIVTAADQVGNWTATGE